MRAFVCRMCVLLIALLAVRSPATWAQTGELVFAVYPFISPTQIVAAGVESAEVGEAPLGMGCEFAQGYGIARPMAAGQVPGWVAAYRPHPTWLKLA